MAVERIVETRGGFGMSGSFVAHISCVLVWIFWFFLPVMSHPPVPHGVYWTGLSQALCRMAEWL
jgi:hypothetical protein